MLMTLEGSIMQKCAHQYALFINAGLWDALEIGIYLI